MDCFDCLVAVAVDTASPWVLDTLKAKFHELIETAFDHFLEVVQNAGYVTGSRGTSPIGRLRRELD
jgi:hypothetical protein